MTTTTKQTVNAEPGLKITDPYKNYDQEEAFVAIQEGKVDEIVRILRVEVDELKMDE